MRLIGQLLASGQVRGGLAVAGLVLLATPQVASAQPEVVVSAATPRTRVGNWQVVNDSTAAGGKAIRHANANASKRTTALASPSHYFELSVAVADNTPYRLWIHGKADRNHWANDSIYVQSSATVTSGRSPIYRIGTTSAATVNLEDCRGCGLSGWKWQDNGYGSGALGPLLYFATTGIHKIRIQTREDGISIDQVVLSPAKYLSARPSGTLTVTQDSSTAPTSTSTTRTSTSAPATTSSSGGTLLKVLDWNTHHGVGTDGVYSIERFIPWIVRSGAQVVSLNEVEKYTGWGNENQPARYAALLKAQTGKTWYYKFAQRDGNTNGQGNLILSTFPFEDTDGYELSYSRSVARVQILVNGIRVNVLSTHLDASSSSRRATQMGELITWARSFSEQRIVCGDFNAWPGAAEIKSMTAGHHDTWAVTKANGTAVAYSGNEAGNTRNSRIDYIWMSRGASRTTIKSSRVFDTRDSRGVMPSDHRPLMTTFEIR